MTSYSTFDHAYGDLLIKLSRNPSFISSPRGNKVKEDLAVTFAIEDPRMRLLHNEARATNYGFAVGEFLWYWQGKTDLETMVYYNKRMRDFSDDGKSLNSAYGALIKGLSDVNWVDQWAIAKRTLQSDPDSRRAILQVHQPVHQYRADHRGSKDVPCTLSLQFFIRDEKLHLHAHMRSNDIIWGLTYDLFSFTLLQECMLLELRESMPTLQLGRYIHTAGSLHLYERHFQQADKMISEYEANAEALYFGEHGRMMENVSSLADLSELCEEEMLLRKGITSRIDHERFVGSLRWMAQQLNAHREKRDAERLRNER